MPENAGAKRSVEPTLLRHEALVCLWIETGKPTLYDDSMNIAQLPLSNRKLPVFVSRTFCERYIIYFMQNYSALSFCYMGKDMKNHRYFFFLPHSNPNILPAIPIIFYQKRRFHFFSIIFTPIKEQQQWNQHTDPPQNQNSIIA